MTKKMTLFEELTWRGLVNQTTFDNREEINTPRTFYLGVDPSAKSMHIGNLVQLMVVKHLIRHGHTPILLAGGATGAIGDPKEDTERELKTMEELAENKAGIIKQYQQLLDEETFDVVDNYDWFKNIGYLEFLREIGKHFSMTQLLDREFIKARIGEGGVGISYAEFSYSLIQGYDFLHLFREKGATLQLGGSDQWGNMLSGAHMIRKMENAEAHVWTVPLVVDKKTGKKFGKSEGNAVWLNPELTSPYQFYQFWLNLDDAGIGEYIKIFTFIEPEDFEELMAGFESDRANRKAQKYLAFEVTKLVHGEKVAESVKRVSEVLFGQTAFSELSSADIEALSREIPTRERVPTVVNGKDAEPSTTITEALQRTGTTKSLGEARRLIEGGAISVDGQKISNDEILQRPCLIKKGKNTFVLVR